MITQKDLVSSIDTYESDIKKAITLARSVHLPEPLSLSFSTSQLVSETIQELASNLPTGYKKVDKDTVFLYIFTLAEDNKIPASDIHFSFESARDWQASDEYDGKNNLCRLNELKKDMSIIYVGRSYKPRERFKQHLSTSVTGTYAMHLALWASDQDIKINFYLYRFTGITNRVAQVLEDGLWDNLKPLLGKRGEK